MEILTNPAILFFVFGLVAGALRSDLEIPGAIAKFLSLYLLMALGLKGGFALEHSGLNFGVTVTLLAAMLMALVVPTLGYLFLKTQVSRLDAAAVAAWRSTTREALTAALDSGHRVLGFTRDGSYVIGSPQ